MKKHRGTKSFDKEYYKWFVATDFCNIIPDAPGCYAIYLANIKTHKWELFYIGTAKNLERRLKKHAVVRVLRCLSDLPNLVAIKCKIIEDSSVRLETERKLIKRLRPQVNYA